MIQTIKEIALFALIFALCALIWQTASKVTAAYLTSQPAPEITQPVLKIDQVQRGNTLITICTDTAKGQLVLCTTIFLPL